MLARPNAKIINISTGLVYAPRVAYPFYNATKAALHSFTQVLRRQLSEHPIQVIEVLLPVVDTPWHKGKKLRSAMSVARAEEAILTGIRANQKEIRVGKVKLLYWLARLWPALACRVINAGENKKLEHK